MGKGIRCLSRAGGLGLAIFLATGLFAAMPLSSQEICVRVLEADGEGPVFEFGITGTTANLIDLTGLQRAEENFVEQVVYGGGSLVDGEAMLSWSRFGNNGYDAFRCTLDLETGSGSASQTKVREAATEVLNDLTCILSCE